MIKDLKGKKDIMKREIENVKKYQMELLELKNTVSEI